MQQYLFKKTIIAFSLGCLFPVVYANSFINPQPIVNLSKDISAQYSGKGVNIGVLDTGYQVEHDLVNRDKWHSIAFELTQPDGEKASFNPDVYEVETMQDWLGREMRLYFLHGGQVAGVIGAKGLPQLGYAGGVAKEADLYVATFEPNGNDKKRLVPKNNDEEMEEEDETEYPPLISSDEPTVQFQRLALATGMNKLADNHLLAINNSWNEDPVGDTAQEMDEAYREYVSNAKDNTLLNAIKGAVAKDTLLVFAAGNEQKKQPGIFAALPRYLPELEKHYLSVIAVDERHRLEKDYSNHCGISKNWCIAAPGSLTVLDTAGADEGKKEAGLSDEVGTSFAAPVVTGSLAVLKERFAYFTPTQVRDVLLTTAKDLGKAGVDEVYGWGVVDMASAIRGPRQLLKDETYTVSQDDVWSNHLTADYSLSKKGAATLALNGQTRLKGIVAAEGKLVLNGVTSADTVENRAHLAVNDLQVAKGFVTHHHSTLELVGKQGISAQGKTAVVQLAGKLAVAEGVQQAAQAGKTVAQVVSLKEGATYQGGFDELAAPSAALSARGLRQDVYFKDQMVEVVANEDKPISIANGDGNAQNGVQVLNRLRDSKWALQKGWYNDWLQQAVVGNHAQGLHYHIGNGIYADSIDWMRSDSALSLHRLSQRLHDYHDLATTKHRVWVEQGKDKRMAKQVNHHEAADVSSRHTALGVARKVSPVVLLAGRVAHTQADVEKAQASSHVKQTALGVAVHYMPQVTGWFADAAVKAARVNYRQNRFFNQMRLGSASNTGQLWGVAARTGYRLAHHDWQVEPYLGMQTVHLKMKGLQEAGELGIATPAVKQTDVNLTSGLRVKKVFNANGWHIAPDVEVNYVHRLNHGKTRLHGTMSNIALKSEATTYGKNQWEMGANLMVSKHKWFASLGWKHHLLNYGKGNSWQAKLGYQF